MRNFASSNKTNDERKISVHSVCAIFDLLKQNEERLSGYRNKKERELVNAHTRAYIIN